MEPKHGDERNRRHEERMETANFQNATTGEPIMVKYAGQSGSVSEKWCAHCNEWVMVGSGYNGGLIGFILCPQCSNTWR